MAANIQRMTEAYLALWKLVDIHFPGHHWLELTSESQDELEGEILRIEPGPWVENQSELVDDIQRTLHLVRARTVSPDWISLAAELRGSLQEKILKYSARLADEA